MKKIETGDVITLGNHFLIYGDATDKNLIESVIGQTKIDAIITDPPYGVAAVEASKNLSARHKKIKNDHHQSDAEYVAFTKNWLSVAIPHLQEKNSVYIFNADPKVFALRRAIGEIGFTFRQLLVWVKTSCTLNRLDYLSQHELILYASFGKRKPMSSKDKSVIVCPKTQNNTIHPTMKPLRLMRRLIQNSTSIGDVIYEPFCGSGSLMISAEQMKRRSICVEQDPEYCEAIIKRFRANFPDQEIKIMTNQNPVNLFTNNPN